MFEVIPHYEMAGRGVACPVEEGRDYPGHTLEQLFLPASLASCTAACSANPVCAGVTLHTTACSLKYKMTNRWVRILVLTQQRFPFYKKVGIFSLNSKIKILFLEAFTLQFLPVCISKQT